MMHFCKISSNNFNTKLNVFIILFPILSREIFSEWNTKDYMKREHSLLKPYQGSGITLPNWDFMGSTIVMDKYIRLTPGLQRKSGLIWNSTHQHPYISSMDNNGSLHYDHDRDGTHTELAGCEVKVRHLQTEAHLLIRYTGNTLNVMTDLEEKEMWKPCINVDGVELPTGYYFGFSAASGDLSDNHEIIAVRLYEVESDDPNEALKDRSNIIPSAKKFSPPREHIEDTKSQSWSGLKIFLTGVWVVYGIGITNKLSHIKHFTE